MKDSRVEVASKMVHKMLEDPESYAVSITQIREFSIAEGNSLSASTIERYLRKMYNDGVMEYKKTCKGKSWRFCGTTNPFPPEYNELIFNCVKQINDETGKPARVSQIMEKMGNILDRRCVHDRLKDMVYHSKVIRMIEKYDRAHAHSYVINSKEYHNITDGIFKKDLGKDDAKSHMDYLRETVSRELGAFWKGDLSSAKEHTHVGDKLDIVVTNSWNDKNKQIKTVTKGVSAVLPNICLFDDGTSLPWIDLAKYYRDGKALEMFVWR